MRGLHYERLGFSLLGTLAEAVNTTQSCPTKEPRTPGTHPPDPILQRWRVAPGVLAPNAFQPAWV